MSTSESLETVILKFDSLNVCKGITNIDSSYPTEHRHKVIKDNWAKYTHKLRPAIFYETSFCPNVKTSCLRKRPTLSLLGNRCNKLKFRNKRQQCRLKELAQTITAFKKKAESLVVLKTIHENTNVTLEEKPLWRNLLKPRKSKIVKVGDIRNIGCCYVYSCI